MKNFTLIKKVELFLNGVENLKNKQFFIGTEKMKNHDRDQNVIKLAKIDLPNHSI